MRADEGISRIKDMQKHQTATALFFVFCTIALVEIVGEILQWQWLILITKPLIAPVLLLYYLVLTPRVNYGLVLALISAWGANILFSFGNLYVELATWIFLIYRFLVLVLTLRIYQIRNWLPVLVGSIPFLFVYLVLLTLYIDNNSLSYMSYMQGGLIAIIGGIALSGFVLRGDLLATLLLISTIMFTGTQFIFVIAKFYPNILVFRPLTMLMYDIGQYALLHFVLLADQLKQRVRLERTDALTEGEDVGQNENQCTEKAD